MIECPETGEEITDPMPAKLTDEIYTVWCPYCRIVHQYNPVRSGGLLNATENAE